jgi:hypothetical protein
MLPPGSPGEWIWVDVPGAKCRSGSQAGLVVRYSDASPNLMIYLEGGGACFNGTTCQSNPDSVSSMGGSDSGIFNTTRPENPVADWNHIRVPYCTGDVFAGSNTDVDVPGGPSGQQFVGYDNIGLMLEMIVPTFPDAEQILLTGGSAGAFGAAYNYDRAAQAFGGNPVTLLDDSAPPMSDTYMVPCLQQAWRDIWGLDATLPADCTECFHMDGGGLVTIPAFLAAKYPSASFGLVSSEQDSTIRSFYGFGANDCDTFLPNMSGAEYQMGLYELRDTYLAPLTGWGSYFITGSTHTWIGSETRFYDTVVGGTVLADWVTDLVAGTTSHVSP